jgi:hypothetical protein
MELEDSYSLTTKRVSIPHTHTHTPHTQHFPEPPFNIILSISRCLPFGIMTTTRGEAIHPSISSSSHSYTLLPNTHPDFGAHLASYSTGNWCPLPWGEAAVAWSWPFNFTYSDVLPSPIWIHGLHKGSVSFRNWSFPQPPDKYPRIAILSCHKALCKRHRPSSLVHHNNMYICNYIYIYISKINYFLSHLFKCRSRSLWNPKSET